MSKIPKILLIEDDRRIATALTQTLRASYNLDIAVNGRLALFKADTDTYDLVLLDLNLPDIPGLVICQKLRNRGINAPILILSGDTKILMKISLLDAGANDYLTKPFALGELEARLRALTRTHAKPAWPAEILEYEGVILNRRTFQVVRDNNMINLRRKEFDLLVCLMENAGQVVLREDLLSQVWQNSDALWTNTLDVHIKLLRDKLDRPFASQLIQTIHGRGYKFDTKPTPTLKSKSKLHGN